MLSGWYGFVSPAAWAESSFGRPGLLRLRTHVRTPRLRQQSGERVVRGLRCGWYRKQVYMPIPSDAGAPKDPHYMELVRYFLIKEVLSENM